jgi:hypothetical protein
VRSYHEFDFFQIMRTLVVFKYISHVDGVFTADCNLIIDSFGSNQSSFEERRKDLVRIGKRALNVLQVWNGAAIEVFHDIAPFNNSDVAAATADEDGLKSRIEELKRRFSIVYCFLYSFLPSLIECSLSCISYKPVCVSALRFIEDYFDNVESYLAQEKMAKFPALLQQSTSTEGQSSEGAGSSD